VIVFLNRIYQFIFVMEMCCVSFEGRTESLHYLQGVPHNQEPMYRTRPRPVGALGRLIILCPFKLIFFIVP
jgi:hypothetical protein